MNPIDILILGLSCICAIICIVLGISKILKFYLGLLMGLLVSILIQLQLNTLTLTGSSGSITDYFLSSNSGFLSSLSVFLVPLFGIIFLVNKNISFKESGSSLISTLFSGLLGLLLLPILLGFYTILANIAGKKNSLFEGFLEILSGSFIGKIFSDFQHYIFLLLFLILLYKFVLRFLFLILIFFLSKIRELRAEERENRKRNEEGDDEDDTNEE